MQLTHETSLKSEERRSEGVLVKSVLIFFIGLSISVQAWSWGAMAHKASAQIAWSFLDRETQVALTKALGGRSISEASVWADSARANPEWKFTIWYHFEKAPDNYTYLQNLQRQSDKYKKLGGLIEALYVAEEVLNDPTSTSLDKENALKFTIHFVGDIHQPLHTGRVEDNSGNKIPVMWNGFKTNLHSVWDSQMIYLAHKSKMIATQDPATAYAMYLMNKYKDYKITPELFVRYDDWMHESMMPRKDAYDYKDESEEDYTNRFIDIVDERVFLAGLRTAYMMKRLLKKEPLTDPLSILKESIIEIVGDFTEFVSLKPKYTTTN